MRIAAFGAVLVLATSAAAAAERSAGVMIFTAPDGTRRVVNIPAAGPAAAGKVPEGATARRAALWPTVEEAARTHGLDPHLVDLVIRMESGYNPRALSPKGAQGVMQLMPTTARLYGVVDAFDPFENIRGGVRYLRDLLLRFDSNLALALAAYNAGPEAVARHGGVPPFAETRAYVAAILAAYAGSAPQTRLSGGFGKPAATPPPVRVASAEPKRPARPVTVIESDSGTLISNAVRTGEAVITRRLALR
ncbi:MAG TPA: lytic transglycosylase domain-containing protein [Thermoanaerobaculaceae bacterium]|nr:lytic transglycosylase domain-containing protein [Thermoanaerobaculaceae bacterium]HRS17043.1 lytic transglycosylase domain-containing protein [Thermoanaerobaculaceae bacterium]